MSGHEGSTSEQELYVGEEIAQGANIFFIIVGILYVIMGTCGNLLVILTVATHRKLRTLHSIFIINLAASDMIILGYIILFVIIDLVNGEHYIGGKGHCIFNGFLIVCAYVASLLTLMVISINRYFNICHSLLYHRVFTKRNTILLCGCIWVLAAVMTVPPMVGWGDFRYDRKVHYCGYDRTANFSYTLFLMLVSIGMPAVVIFICNFLIYRFVRNAKRRIRNASSGSTQGPKATEISLIKTLFVVFLSFSALMCPYMIANIADTSDSWPAVAHLSCSFTSFTNSCTNWIIYGLMNRNFREGYTKLVCFWRKPVQIHATSNVSNVSNMAPQNSNPSDTTRCPPDLEDKKSCISPEQGGNQLLSAKGLTSTTG